MKSGDSTPEQLIAQRIREVFESERAMDNRVFSLVQYIQENEPQKNLPPTQKAQFEKMIEPYREYAEFLKQSHFNNYKPNKDDSLASHLSSWQAALNSDDFEGKKNFYRKAFLEGDQNTKFLGTLNQFKEKDPALKSFLEGFDLKLTSSTNQRSGSDEVKALNDKEPDKNIRSTLFSLMMEPVQRGPRHELYFKEVQDALKKLQNKEVLLEEKDRDLGKKPDDVLSDLAKLQGETSKLMQGANRQVRDRDFAAIIGPLTKELVRKRDELDKESQGVHAKTSTSYAASTNYKKQQLDDLIEGIKLAGTDVNIARKYLELAKNDDKLTSSRGFSKSGVEKILNEGIKQIDSKFLDAKSNLSKEPLPNTISEYHEMQKAAASDFYKQSITGANKQSESATAKMDSKHMLDTQLPSHKEAFQKAKAEDILKAEIEARVPPPPSISPEEEHRQGLEKQKEGLTSDFMQSINAVSKAAKEVSKAEKAIRMEDRNQAKQDIEKSKQDIESQFRAEVEAKVKMADAAALKESQALDREIQARAESHTRKLSESDHQMNVSRKEEMRERVQGSRAGKDDIPPPPPLDDREPPPPAPLAEWDEDFPPPPIPENYVPPPAISPEEEAVMLRREALVNTLDDARVRLASAMAERNMLQEKLANISNELAGKVANPVPNKVEVQHEEKIVHDAIHHEVEDFTSPVFHEEVEAEIEAEEDYDAMLDDVFDEIGFGEGINIEAEHLELPDAEVMSQELMDELELESELDMMYQEQQQISVHR